MYAELLRLSQPLTVITHLNKACRCMKTMDQLELTPVPRLHITISVSRISFQPCQMSHAMLLYTLLFSIVSVSKRLTPYTRPNITLPTCNCHACQRHIHFFPSYPPCHIPLYTIVVPSLPTTLLLDAHAPRPKPLSGATSTSDVCTGAIPP